MTLSQNVRPSWNEECRSVVDEKRQRDLGVNQQGRSQRDAGFQELIEGAFQRVDGRSLK